LYFRSCKKKWSKRVLGRRHLSAIICQYVLAAVAAIKKGIAERGRGSERKVERENHQLHPLLVEGDFCWIGGRKCRK
jgi:hypothetical protein